jgi:hypothetical protein
METHGWTPFGLVHSPGQRDRFALTENLTGSLQGYTYSSGLGQGQLIGTVIPAQVN